MAKAFVFGTGDYYQRKKGSICEEISGYLDNYKKGIFEEKEVYPPEMLKQMEYDKVYVMGGDFVFPQMVHQLLELGVDAGKIVIGQNLPPYTARESLCLKDGGKIFITDGKHLCYGKDGMVVSFNTYDECCGIWDIFGERVYDYYLGEGRQVVIDIGMNIGAASIYFANKSQVEKVYAYEPFPDTYRHALENIAFSGKEGGRNPAILKICAVNAGLSGRQEVKQVVYNGSMTCGMAIEQGMQNRAASQYQEWGFYDESKTQMAEVQVLDAAEEVGRILAAHPKEDVVLKMDCEGSEYAILQRLSERGLLGGIRLVMMEWHYNGKEPIEAYLKEAGFAYFSFQKSGHMGVVYAVNQAGQNQERCSVRSGKC